MEWALGARLTGFKPGLPQYHLGGLRQKLPFPPRRDKIYLCSRRLEGSECI